MQSILNQKSFIPWGWIPGKKIDGIKKECLSYRSRFCELIQDLKYRDDKSKNAPEMRSALVSIGFQKVWLTCGLLEQITIEDFLRVNSFSFAPLVLQ